MFDVKETYVKWSCFYFIFFKKKLMDLAGCNFTSRGKTILYWTERMGEKNFNFCILYF